MWLDRLTGKQLRELPAQVVSGRYWAAATRLTLNGHTPDFSGVLVDDEGQRCQLGEQLRSFDLPRLIDAAGSELLSKALDTIDAASQQCHTLVSPLMPSAVVDNQGHLQLFEERLLEVVREGHLHRISQRPRLDMHYEDEVTDIARARRLSKGALVHLASHSECWQRQTLSGVIPRKVLARFSEDDYGIYENCVYARLLDKIDRYLRARLSTLKSLYTTLEQAMEFYQSSDIDHRLAHAVCSIWGMTFDENATGEVTALLSDTLEKLQALHKTIRGLQQSGLYMLVDRNAQVESGLHRTNILNHDPHYRHVATLWELLGRSQAGIRVTAEDRFKRNQYLAQAYSRYAGLVLRRSLQPYLNGKDEAEWAGRYLKLRQNGLEWELVSNRVGSADEQVLLTVVPWFTFGERLEQELPKNRFIAWPSLGSERPEDAYLGQWIPLSPSDMYCEERFGLLVDQTLQGILLNNFCLPLTKVPTTVMKLASGIASLTVGSKSKSITVCDELGKGDLKSLQELLKSENCSGLLAELQARTEEIKALHKCPICAQKVRFLFQPPSGFSADCAECGVKRYLKGQIGLRKYHQTVDGKCDFQNLGRRAWSLSIDS